MKIETVLKICLPLLLALAGCATRPMEGPQDVNDPLEGTNLCALGTNNAIAVLAAAPKGGLLHAPDLYMEKLVVGPSSRGVVDIDAPVKDNLLAKIGRAHV